METTGVCKLGLLEGREVLRGYYSSRSAGECEKALRYVRIRCYINIVRCLLSIKVLVAAQLTKSNPNLIEAEVILRDAVHTAPYTANPYTTSSYIPSPQISLKNHSIFPTRNPSVEIE